MAGYGEGVAGRVECWVAGLVGSGGGWPGPAGSGRKVGWAGWLAGGGQDGVLAGRVGGGWYERSHSPKG